MSAVTVDEALTNLLASLFAVDELRRFLCRGPDGQVIEQALPGPTADFAHVVDSAIRALRRHGRLDATFFDRLDAERPGRAFEIGAIRAVVLQAGSGGSSGVDGTTCLSRQAVTSHAMRHDVDSPTLERGSGQHRENLSKQPPELTGVAHQFSKFETRERILVSLVRFIWEYPDVGGIQRSWAVKESATIRGEFDRAAQRPGLGVALFTTELAESLFGDDAQEKVRNVVHWGVRQTAPSAPHLVLESTYDPVRDADSPVGDLRHTVALAILMRRAGTHEGMRQTYLHLLLDSFRRDDGWPSTMSGGPGDVISTTYVIEFLALCKSSIGGALEPHVEEALESACRWLVSSAKEGFWNSDIFHGARWERIWTTSYMMMRLLATTPSTSHDWVATMRRAAMSLLYEAHDARRLMYTGDALRLRVETRVAAALDAAVKGTMLGPELIDRAEAWIQDWEDRFICAFDSRHDNVPDLATATFASRAMLRKMDRRSVAMAARGRAPT